MIRINTTKPQISSSQNTDIPRLATTFKTQIQSFNDGLIFLLDHPDSCNDEEFLKKIRGSILALAETAKQINGEQPYVI